MRQYGRWALAAALMLLVTGEHLQAQSTDSAGAEAQLLSDLIHRVEEQYVDSLPPKELYAAAARGVVKYLNDRYTALLAGEAANMWNFGGIGLGFFIRNGTIIVATLNPGAPAATAGVHVGDRIVEIAGKSTDGWTVDQLVNAARGKVGTPVALTLRRPGVAQPLVITLTRAVIETKPVQPGVLLEDSIGYVAFDAFTPDAAEQLKAQIVALKVKGMRALVLDLRHNGGGAIDQGVGAADLFLDAGRRITSTRSRVAELNAQYDDGAAQLWPDLPIAVLVGPQTASAAEIFSAALQENDRAVLVGNVTFGKGVGQSQMGLNDTMSLRLTTLRWYTPTGRNIHREPGDTVVRLRAMESSDSALRTRPLLRTAGGRQVRGGSGIVPDVVVEASAADRALKEAIKYDDAALAIAVAMAAGEVQNGGSITSEHFTITPAMREMVRQSLESQGIVIPAKAFAALSPAVDRQLRREIVARVFGPAAALRYDDWATVATGLLRKGRAPQDLLRLATSTQGYINAGD